MENNRPIRAKVRLDIGTLENEGIGNFCPTYWPIAAINGPNFKFPHFPTSL
jgi:hypothetical protein